MATKSVNILMMNHAYMSSIMMNHAYMRPIIYLASPPLAGQGLAIRSIEDLVLWQECVAWGGWLAWAYLTFPAFLTTIPCL